MMRIVAAAYDRIMKGVEDAGLAQWRTDLLGGLTGDVLEIGSGTGRNLAYYPAGVGRLVLTEPDRHMRARLVRAAAGRRDLEVVDAPAEDLPFDNASFDAVVCTLVLCSVDDPTRALAEAYRVLRPGGSLVFIEHVAAAERTRRLLWQHRLEPVWKRLAGNCHLTRRTEESIVSSGFELLDVQHASMRKAPPIVRPTVRGVARRPAA
jgi:ubiquinone/menaquinone biosynthesis C-methylase UbiE